ncbi:IS256 family transposase, partial [Corynebacterium frankenforstense]|nr:IS256 family transposase [Corynebacterium frankenforstense]
TRHRPDQTHTRDFKAFHTYVTGTASLTKVADTLNVSRRTLDRRFTSLWIIDVPNTPDPNRVYDQIFIDGTYTDAGCLLV